MVINAGLLAHTHKHTHTCKHTHTATFPRLNKCQIRSSQQEITSRSWSRSFLRACDPLHIPPAAAGLCISTVQAHTHTHLSVIQQYASSAIWGSQAPSYCVKIACCKRIHEHKHWWPGQFFQEICNTIFVRVYYFRCWICWQADNAPLNVQLQVPPVFMLHSQLFLRTSNKNLLQTGCSYFY